MVGGKRSWTNFGERISHDNECVDIFNIPPPPGLSQMVDPDCDADHTLKALRCVMDVQPPSETGRFAPTDAAKSMVAYWWDLSMQYSVGDQHASPLIGSHGLMEGPSGQITLPAKSLPVVIPCPFALERVASVNFDPTVHAYTADAAATRAEGTLKIPQHQVQTALAPRKIRRRITRKQRPSAQPDASANGKADALLTEIAETEDVIAPPASVPRSPRNTCDAEWQDRFEKRQRVVAMVKASEDYQTWLSRQQRDTLREPLTPNASDRDVSKRQWESKVAQWRSALRSIEDQHCDSSI